MSVPSHERKLTARFGHSPGWLLCFWIRSVIKFFSFVCVTSLSCLTHAHNVKRQRRDTKLFGTNWVQSAVFSGESQVSFLSPSHHTMEALYSVPFMLFEVPNLKLKRPSWFQQPSAMTVFSFVLLSYFLVTGGEFLEGFKSLEIVINWIFFVFSGIIYDVIVEPPSVGSTTDEHGHSRPVIPDASIDEA